MSIFVFGSNLAGRHGKGAALHAKLHYGAIVGRGVGRQGNSYAIPTKDYSLHTLPLSIIRQHVNNFIAYAKNNSKETFILTAIGCGLAGYEPNDIAHMFVDTPSNVELPNEFKQIIADHCGLVNK